MYLALLPPANWLLALNQGLTSFSRSRPRVASLFVTWTQRIAFAPVDDRLSRADQRSAEPSVRSLEPAVAWTPATLAWELFSAPRVRLIASARDGWADKWIARADRRGAALVLSQAGACWARRRPVRSTVSVSSSRSSRGK